MMILILIKDFFKKIKGGGDLALNFSMGDGFLYLGKGDLQNFISLLLHVIMLLK